MAKRKGARKGGHISKPKQLRKRLRKAEAQLVKAGADLDEAQARVEALAIIADEMRAQLVEAERVTAAAEAAPATDGAATRRSPSTRAPSASKQPPATTRSSATTRPPAATPSPATKAAS